MARRLWPVLLLAPALALGAWAPRPYEPLGDGGEPPAALRVMGQLELPATTVDGQRLGGLSGLAWDGARGVLYAVSDRGALFHLRPVWREGRLVDVELLAAVALRDRHGAPLSPSERDAEGLVLVDQGEAEPRLLVSFEGRPRVSWYRTDGQWLGDQRLPPALRQVRRYAHPNRGLEALAWDPLAGALVGPELPLAGGRAGEVPLYALDGRHWHWRLAAAAGSALVAMESLGPGRLLVMERAYVAPWRPLVISISEAHLGADGRVRARRLAAMDNSRGWRIDNFEGLTRHAPGRFLIVSDDNFSALQRTLLMDIGLPELEAARAAQR